VGRGHPCGCLEEPEPNVAYPAFNSEKPLYGVMWVDSEFGNLQSGTPYHFALDESGGTGTGHDRLYIDLDGDRDLSNASPVMPMRDVPDGALAEGDWIQHQVCFDCLTFSSGSEAEVCSVQAIPRLTGNKSGYSVLTFTPTQAFRGEIEIAHQQYEAVMANIYPLGTRWDRPGTFLELRPKSNNARRPTWLYADRLMALHKIAGIYWRLSTTPSGGRLFVERYTGEFGTFQVGPKGWFDGGAESAGTLIAKDKAVAIGRDDTRSDAWWVKGCEIPVGDYLPAMLSIRRGLLAIDISDNYHADGLPRGRTSELTYALKVRKDQSCVLDFSDKPEILFASPARDARLKPGDELRVMAVLVDPKLDVMIRGLSMKKHEPLSPMILTVMAIIAVGPSAIWLLAGKGRRRHRCLPFLSIAGIVLLAGYLGGLRAFNKILYPERDSMNSYDKLTPSVAIFRADGKRVAEGVMPFG